MRWEYTEAKIQANKLAAELNKLGAEGWELVQIWKEMGLFIGVLKRPAN